MPDRFWLMLLVLAARGMPLAPVRAANITSVAGLGAISPLIDTAFATCSPREFLPALVR